MTAHVPPPGIAAKYAAQCPRCDKPVSVGDRVVHQRGSYIHVACANGADDE